MRLSPSTFMLLNTAATAVLWIAPLSCSAFQVGSPLRPSSTTFGSRSWVQTQSRCTQERSKLHMGFMEDFLSGQDTEARKKANDQYLAKLQQRVDRINALESSVEELGDDELQQKTDEFRKRLASGEDINGKLLEEAFAVVREAAWYVVLPIAAFSINVVKSRRFEL